MSLPPATAVGALYDRLLQSALRQFFDRATLDAEPTTSPSPDGRLAIEPSANPAALIIRWFGTRYTLRVPGRWPFTAHEVRLAQAIGAVLAARYRAILNPQIIAERGDLFRGAIEDRYVGAFLDHRPYAIESREARADRIASVIELLRVAALSSYENRPISTGVLLLGTTDDPSRPGKTSSVTAPGYTESLTAIKSFYRLADGVRTVFLANAEGRLLDIIDVERWGAQIWEPATTSDRVRAHVSAARQSDDAGRARLRGAQPVARDQDLRRGRGGLRVPGRRLAPAGPSGQVPPVGRGRRERRAREAHLSDGARSGGRAAGRAVRRGRRSREVRGSWWRPPIGSTCRCPRRPSPERRPRAAISFTCSRGDRQPTSTGTCLRRWRRSTGRRSSTGPVVCLRRARFCAIRRPTMPNTAA